MAVVIHTEDRGGEVPVIVGVYRESAREERAFVAAYLRDRGLPEIADEIERARHLTRASRKPAEILSRTA